MPIRIILFLLLITSGINPQALDSLWAEKFLKSLIANDRSLSSFVSPENLNISNRLGISYEGVENKFLISYEIDSAIASGIKSGNMQYEYKLVEQNNGYSILKFSVPLRNYRKEYYFHNGSLISPPQYFACDWKTFESGYFKFFISDPSLFNQYCADALNKFTEETAKTLNYSEKELSLLKEKKIYYYLCRNDEEIKRLTGYSALGMYNLAYDYIIATYTCHYHELIHLLMNYKLKSIPLYTSPFLQEGIAVALGGRGGKAPGVILDMGAFLVNSDMLDYSSLLEKEQFRQMDPSMSYAVSGLYNLFLLQNIGIDNYIKLYRKYSGFAADDMNILKGDLPEMENWRKFAAGYKSESLIMPNPVYNPASQKIFAAKYKIYDGGDVWIFEIKDTVTVNTGEQLDNYISRIFQEIAPDKGYNGMRYLITAEANEISIYDLYTNELIGKYTSSFTVKMEPALKNAKGYYFFSVSKSIFSKSKNFIF